MEERKEKVGSTLELDRRTFLQVTAGAAATAAGVAALSSGGKAEAAYSGQIPDTPYTDPGVRSVYSVCLQCRSDCGIVAHVRDGVLMNVKGNPYHPNCMEAEEIIPYATDPGSVTKRGRLCPRGNAAPEVLYDPLRITQPLKRVGSRGAGQWQSITWEQAVEEIVEGGNLFGEGNVEGLRAIRGDLGLIDSDIPELGKKPNQAVVMVGRMEEGQSEFNDRFWNKCFGSVNQRLSHGSICEESWFIGAGESGSTNRKPDFVNCKYLLCFGNNYFEANFPMQTIGRKIVNGFRKGGGKLVVVDPRFSNVAAKSDRWVPVLPGGDIGIIDGMIRWIIENRRYNEEFLKTSSAAAATALHGKDRKTKNIETHSSAAHLVIVDATHANKRKFLRADEAGLDGGTNTEFVVAVGTTPTRNTQVATVADIYATDLEFSGTVNGIQVKTAFLLLKEFVQQRSYAEYAAIAGVEESLITTLASEFTSYGTRAVADSYRAVAKKTSGTYASFAVAILNVLIGNIDRIGGWANGGGKYTYMTGTVDLNAVPNGVTASGVNAVRNKEYLPANVPKLIARDGYPPPRPWYTHNPWQEILPAIKARYPYPVKCLWMYWADPAYTIPGGRAIADEVLSSRQILPLFVAVDININESTKWADYILPDGTYLERWGTPGTHPTVPTRCLAWRQPVVGTYDAGTADERDASAPFDLAAANEYTPYHPGTKTLEDIYIMIGKRMELPGFGEGAFADGSPLHRAWDYYKLVLNNLVADANAKGIAVTAEEIIARGGVFQKSEDGYDITTDFLLNRQNGKNNLYSEKHARYLNTRTVTQWDPSTGKPLNGDYFSGYPEIWIQAKDSMGNPVVDNGGPLTLITYKPSFHTQSRTIVCPSLQMHMPESFVEMNSADAQARGIESGDVVKITSASNPSGVVGKAKVGEGIRPGVVAIPNSMGHWEMRSRPMSVDGHAADYDPARALGLNSNLLTKMDPVLGDIVLTDPIGVSTSFYETRVEVTKL